MAYPATIETLPTSHEDNVGENVVAVTDNDQARIINAIMLELGIQPSASYPDVATKLGKLFNEADPISGGDVLAWDSGLGRFVPKPPVVGIPAGIYVPYGGSVAPAGWLLCDGTHYSRTTYAALYAAIGFNYSDVPGTDPGSGLFRVPDMRGRLPAGKGTHGDVDGLGKSEGIFTVAWRRIRHKHTVNETPHTHTESRAYGSGDAQGGGGGIFPFNANSFPASGGATTGLTVGPQTGAEPTDSAGYLVSNYIIKT